MKQCSLCTLDWRVTVVDLGVNFASIVIENFISGKMVPTNRAWFNHKNSWMYFQSHAEKKLTQTVIGAGKSGIANFAR